MHSSRMHTARCSGHLSWHTCPPPPQTCMPLLSCMPPVTHAPITRTPCHAHPHHACHTHPHHTCPHHACPLSCMPPLTHTPLAYMPPCHAHYHICPLSCTTPLPHMTPPQPCTTPLPVNRMTDRQTGVKRCGGKNSVSLSSGLQQWARGLRHYKYNFHGRLYANTSLNTSKSSRLTKPQIHSAPKYQKNRNYTMRLLF